MVFRFSKELYTKEAVFKAAYSYTDKAYLHIDVDELNYLINVEAKSETDPIDEAEFQNEMLAQMVRQYIQIQTKNVRELILARAFSSTLIEKVSDPSEITEESSLDINSILTDWFTKYE